MKDETPPDMERGIQEGGDGDKPEVEMLGRRARLPRSRILRMATGVAFVVFGILGFLPVLGFWMIPLGLAILAVDVPAVARLRGRAERWIGWRQ